MNLLGWDIKKFRYEFADLCLLYIRWRFLLQKGLNVSEASLEAEQTFENEYPPIYIINYNIILNNQTAIKPKKGLVINGTLCKDGELIIWRS